MNIHAQASGRLLRRAIGVAVMTLLASSLCLLLLYLKGADAITQEVRFGLVRLAETAAIFVDGDVHLTFTSPEQEQGAAYQQAIAPLRKILESHPEIRFLYTMVLHNQKPCFVLDATPPGDVDHDGVEDHSPVMQPFDTPAPELMTALTTGRSGADTQPIVDRWGTYLSGYAPIHDSHGRVAGIAGVDLRVDRYAQRLADMRRALVFSLIAAVGLSLLIGLGVWWLGRRAMKAERLRLAADEAVRLSEVELNGILDTTADGILAVDGAGRVMRANQKFAELWRIPQVLLESHDDESLLRSVLDQLVSPGEFLKEVRRLYATHEVSCDGVDFKDGRYFERRSAPLIIGGEVKGRVWSFSDITARHRAEIALVQSELRFRTLLEQAPLAVSMSREGKVVYANHKFREVFGVQGGDDPIGHPVAEYFMPQGGAEGEDRSHGSGRASAAPDEGESVGLRKDGVQFPIQVTVAPVHLSEGDAMLAFVADITHRKRAEAERGTLEARLRQAHKMESVGRLAGGVAHDFNNMLGVILGHTELVRDKVDPADPIRADLDEIQKAAARSVDLTRQLLAFARKQLIAPKVLDLNDAVVSSLKLLRRLIGEDVTLAWCPKSGLWPVKLDPSQMGQVLTNLCINARDAIGGIGTISISTTNVIIEQAHCVNHAGFVPGAYVLLTVRDDGCGMDKEVIANIFEPFFTTKDVGEGTGLGLATVYGIVKQNNGFIYVESELGKGTTFSLYLPRFEGSVVKPAEDISEEVVQGRGETVLLVEDETSLRVTCGLFLESLGYKIMVAETPAMALELAARNRGGINLILTDVIMPGMNGRDMVERILADRHDVKVLFMSGHTAEVIAERGALDEKVCFIQKPFTRNDLARKVRDALE